MWLFYYFITFVCLYCFIHFYSTVTISTSYEFVFRMDLWKIINKLKLKTTTLYSPIKKKTLKI
jgi:hypothetical protein